MDIDIEMGIFLIYAAVILLVVLFGKVLLVPMKLLFKLIANSMVGVMFLILLNVAGTSVGMVMPLNIITAVIAGVLGLPGVAGLVIYFNGFA